VLLVASFLLQNHELLLFIRQNRFEHRLPDDPVVEIRAEFRQKRNSVFVPAKAGTLEFTLQGQSFRSFSGGGHPAKV